MNNHTVKRAVVGEYGKSAHVTRREMIRQPPSLNLTMSQVVCVQQRECQINTGSAAQRKPVERAAQCTQCQQNTLQLSIPTLTAKEDQTHTRADHNLQSHK